MAALTDFNDYKRRLTAPRDTAFVSKTQTGVTQGKPFDWWTRSYAPIAAANPSTPVALTRASSGALGQENGAAEDLYVLGGHLGGNTGMHVLCDRLSHNGGMSGTDVTPNLTTNLPTAPLTRYTSGDGVMAAAEMYLAVGSTGTTISFSYTNQAGVAGRISPPTTFGSSLYNAASRLVPLALMAGDTGIRSIENSTLAATTGTVGNWGYVLFKPLMAFSLDTDFTSDNLSIVDGGMCGGLPVIQDDACLFWFTISGSTSAEFYAAVPFTAV